MRLFIKFFFTGASGALLSIAVTWALTTYLVGQANYFSAYLVGIAANIAFNFTVYTLAVFQTSRNHVARLVLYTLYSFAMAYLQSGVVRFVVSLVGTHWYLLVIAGTIGAFAVFNFFVFRQSLFKELEEGQGINRTHVALYVGLCALLALLATGLHFLARGA